MLTLTLRDAISLPLELAEVTPAVLVCRSTREIERTCLHLGNRPTRLGELFSLAGSVDDGQLTFVGDLHSAVGIGTGMNAGTIRVEGNAGHDVGLGMRAGELEIVGDVADNAGAEMCGGVIRIHGSSGANLGGALVGSARGMSGGTILVDGDAGTMVGQRMRRGLIAVRNNTSGYTGYGMLAGSIVVLGECGEYPGVQMSRGTIVVGSQSPARLLPTFGYACTTHPPVLGLIGRQLQMHGFENRLGNAGQRWRQLSGDFLNSGRGEIFVAHC